MLVLVPTTKEVINTLLLSLYMSPKHSFIDRRPIDPPPIIQIKLNNATPQQTEYVLRSKRRKKNLSDLYIFLQYLPPKFLFLHVR
jgi:hypothetical protein